MNIFVICLILSALRGFIDGTEGLVELPQVEDNEILNTENLIRSSTNDLFFSLGLKGVKEKPRLKQYALIHNFFISLTLRDHNTLKDVARLTRVDKNIDNKTENFITLLNEILNGDHSSEVQVRNTSITEDVDEDFINYLDSQLKSLGYLKFDYINNNPPADINNDIIDILSRNDELKQFNETINKQELFDENLVIQKVPGDQSGRRIFKGHHTKVRYYPFAAVVQIFGKFHCGGAIISTDMVITAASCVQLAYNNRFYLENPSFLSVRVGSNYYKFGGDVIPIMEIYFHPQYDPKTLQNNLAGLRMRLHVYFYRRVKKVEIDRNAKPLPSNTPGIMIVGWGAKSRSNIVKGPWENTITVDELPFYPLRACQEVYSKSESASKTSIYRVKMYWLTVRFSCRDFFCREVVTQKNFCAGYNVKGSGACQSDAGNPGVANGRLVGIVSFGSPVCGTPDSPTVFTKLGYYIEWIDNILLQRKRIKKIGTKKTTYYNFFKDPKRSKMPITTTTKAVFTSNTTGGNIRSIRLDSKSIEDLELDKKMFRDFLGTMFNNSKEVQDYMDVVEETGNIQKICKSCKAGENLKPKKILDSIENRFKNDSLISETINSLKSKMEYDANKNLTKDVTQINTYFDLLDIDDLSENKSEKINKETEESETNTTVNTSEQDEFVENSLLDVLLDSAKKNTFMTDVPDLPFTKMNNNGLLDEAKFRAKSESNDYSNIANKLEEKGLDIAINKDKDLVTTLLLSNDEKTDPSKLINLNNTLLKTPEDTEETLYLTIDNSSGNDSSKRSSSEESLLIDIPQNNLNALSNFNDDSLKDLKKNLTDEDFAKTLMLDKLLDKIQNEILAVPNPE